MVLSFCLMSYLDSWQNFYIITGSAAAGLTGLMFVVITLVKSVRSKVSEEIIATFTTPTVVHFSLAFVMSVLLSAPWTTFSYLILLLCLVSIGGFIYVVIVARRMKRTTDNPVVGEYTPVVEDWVWYVIFPLILYTAFFTGAILLPMNPSLILFGIGAVLVLLVLVSIHNAWDSVVYIVTGVNNQ